MWKNSARMLVVAVIVLLAGVMGCASTKSDRSTRDSAYASGVSGAPSGGSCH